jgi:molybdopterin converting factor small subunit
MAQSSSTLRVLFFGPVRTQLGTSAIDLPCAGTLSPDELWALLLGRFAELKPLRSAIRLARNGEFIAPDAALRPGDEIALIPPVSGG